MVWDDDDDNDAVKRFSPVRREINKQKQQNDCKLTLFYTVFTFDKFERTGCKNE